MLGGSAPLSTSVPRPRLCSHMQADVLSPGVPCCVALFHTWLTPSLPSCSWVLWEGAEVLVGASQDRQGGCSWGCTTSPAASPPAARLGCARGALLHVRERFWVMERPGQGLCWGSGGPGSWVLLVPWMLTTSTSTGEVCGHRTAHASPLLGCPATGWPKCSGKGSDTALRVPPGTALCC